MYVRYDVHVRVAYVQFCIWIASKCGVVAVIIHLATIHIFQHTCMYMINHVPHDFIYWNVLIIKTALPAYIYENRNMFLYVPYV